MRLSPHRFLGALFALSVAVPVLVVVPTVTRPQAAPHPVAARLTTIRLSGVDAAAAAAGTPAVVARRLATPLAADQSLSTAAAAAAAANHPPAVLTAPTPTSRFATVGVTWAATAKPADVLVTVRVRTNGRWGPWHVIGGQTDDVPDGAELAGVRGGTSPLYVGESDGVQVRVDRLSGPLPQDLRVDLIDPGTSPADATLGQAAPASSAMAAGDRPPIITRKQWGADESIREPTYVDTTVKAAFIHHTASSTAYTAAQAAAMIRGIYSYAVMSEGYADMPYNFLVDKYGRIYEGRKGSLSEAIHGGATGGFNTDSMAVSALGNFESSSAPAVMVDAIARLLAWRLAAFYRDPTGHTTLTDADGGTKFPIGKRVRFRVISGHRDADLTACPGGHLYAQLDTIRSKTTAYMGANLVNPGLASTSRRVGATAGRSSFTVTSKVMKRQHWQLTVTPSCGTAPVRTLTGTATRRQPISVAWHGLDDAGNPVLPGSYLLQLDSWAGRSRSVSWARQVVVGAASPGNGGSGVRGSGPAGWFTPVAPTMLLNTQTGVGTATPYVLAHNGRLDLPVLGRAGVPAEGVSAVVLSLRTTCAARTVRLSVKPSLAAGAGETLRLRAHSPGQALTVVAPGRDGQVSVTNSGGAAPVTVDVVGYFTTGSGSAPASGSGYVPVRPVTVAGAGTPLSVSGPTPVSLATSASPVPAGAVAAWLQVRTRGDSQAQRLWVWADGAKRPLPPQIVTTPRQISTHRVLVPLGANDRIDLAADAPGLVSVSVTGYQVTGTGARWHTDGPRQLLSGKVLAPGAVLRQPVAGHTVGVPPRARYVVVQLGVRAQSEASRLSVYAADASRPRTADLVTAAGTPGTSMVVVRLSPTGAIRVHNGRGRAAVTMDVVGWLR